MKRLYSIAGTILVPEDLDVSDIVGDIGVQKGVELDLDQLDYICDEED